MMNIGSLSGNGGNVCEEMMIVVCFLHGVRWRGHSSNMLAVEGRRYKWWWSEKGDGVGGMGVMVKEKLCLKSAQI